MIPGSLLVALLSLALPAESAGEPPAPTVHDDATDGEYQEALERVRTAQQMANGDPERGSVQLRDALQLLIGYGPQLAKDPKGQDLRTMAQLTLSRALLATEDGEGARDAMDDAIRTSRGDPLPTKQFGPGLTALHKERSGNLAKLGAGTIEVTCKVPCRVYINERPTRVRTEGLVPGTYRVWVESNDGSQTPLQTSVDVVANEALALSYGVAVSPPLDGNNGGGNGDDDPRPASKRIMPRWAEVVLMTVGAAGIGAGAALWAIDQNCPNGSDPMGPDAATGCPEVYMTKTAGISTLAAGAAVFLVGTITLTVDEVRVGRRQGNAVALTWTMRF